MTLIAAVPAVGPGAARPLNEYVALGCSAATKVALEGLELAGDDVAVRGEDVRRVRRLRRAFLKLVLEDVLLRRGDFGRPARATALDDIIRAEARLVEPMLSGFRARAARDGWLAAVRLELDRVAACERRLKASD